MHAVRRSDRFPRTEGPARIWRPSFLEIRWRLVLASACRRHLAEPPPVKVWEWGCSSLSAFTSPAKLVGHRRGVAAVEPGNAPSRGARSLGPQQPNHDLRACVLADGDKVYPALAAARLSAGGSSVALDGLDLDWLGLAWESWLKTRLKTSSVSLPPFRPRGRP